MKIFNNIIISLISASFLLVSCNSETTTSAPATQAHDDHAHDDHEDVVVLTDQQFRAMNLKIDTLPLRNVSKTVKANGQLEVPPQHEAAVTAIVGANISAIHVIEGDSVYKGQILATLSHPDLVTLQTEYLDAKNQLQYLQQEIARQQKLYDESVGSGKVLQRTQAEFQSAKGAVAGSEAKLRLLGLNTERIAEGEIFTSVSVPSPIEGYIRNVKIKTGQYVAPQTELFDVVNVSHIHADFMVFEKDMQKIRVGQKVRFNTDSRPDTEMMATIFSVGKSFEEEHRALHLHADIDNKKGILLPGMYVSGQVLLSDSMRYALPEAAIIRHESKHYIFTAEKDLHDGEVEWHFEPLEVIILSTDRGWTAFEPTEKTTKEVVWNGAYYLMAELKKHEVEHSH